MVRDFQSVIGREAREQILEQEGRLPDVLIACVGGGSNSIGLFHPFLATRRCDDRRRSRRRTGTSLGQHAARFNDGGGGQPGVLQGTMSYVLQDSDGQIASDSFDLRRSRLSRRSVRSTRFCTIAGRVEYVAFDDAEALEAFQILAKFEGIIPALESAHAVAYAVRLASKLPANKSIVINLSGRGDKDLASVQPLVSGLRKRS